MDSTILARVAIRSWENISFLLIGFLVCWLYMRLRKPLAMWLHTRRLHKQLNEFDKFLGSIDRHQK